MTVAEGATVREALRRLQEKELSFKQSYWVTKILTKLEGPLKPFDSVRDEAIKKYGVSKDGGWVIDTVEAIEKYQNELKDIIQDTIDVDVRLLKLEDFEDVTITGLVGDTLLRFVFEEGEDFANGASRDDTGNIEAEGRSD